MTTKFTGNITSSGSLVATQTWVNSQGYGAGAGGSIDTLSDVDTTTSAPSTGQVLKWNGTNWTPQVDLASSSSDVVSDTTPQLGGNLDLNSKNITGTGNISITGDLTVSGKALYSNVYTNLSDLPSASTYHGMFAHVHSTGKAYFAHGGAWIVLIDESSSTTTNLTEGTNLYFTEARVNAHLNVGGASSGQILSWNGSDYTWVTDQTGGGGGGTPGGANTQVQYNNSGAFGAESDFTYNASTNTLSVVNLVATSISTTGAGSTTITAGANIELNATNRVLITDTPFRLASFTTTTRNAISSPVNGDMIYNSTTNQLESYENSAWVATAGSSSGGIASVVADTTPQLGGDLDVNGKTIAHTFTLGANGSSDYTCSSRYNTTAWWRFRCQWKNNCTYIYTRC